MPEENAPPRDLLLNPITPEEALAAGFQVTEHTLSTNENLHHTFKLLRFVDYDGKQITLPLSCYWENANLISDEIKKFGYKVDPMEITEENKHRFNYCIEKLKLPPLIAARIAFDRLDISLDDFKIPKEDTPQTVLIDVKSIESGQGKSLFCAVMNLHCDIPFYSVDVFSGIGPEQYLEMFKDKGFNKDTPVHELTSVGEEIRKEGKRPPRTKGIPPLGNLLDKMIEDFKETPLRHSFILVEGISTPKRNFSTDSYTIASTSLDAHAYLDQPRLGTEPWIYKGTADTIYPLHISIDHFAFPEEVAKILQLIADKTRKDIPTPLIN